MEEVKSLASSVAGRWNGEVDVLAQGEKGCYSNFRSRDMIRNILPQPQNYRMEENRHFSIKGLTFQEEPEKKGR